MSKLRVGTRASALAVTQTRTVVRAFAASSPHLEIEEVAITSEGDRNSEPLSMAQTPGIFVSALRDELLAGTVDFIVHSMKDLPAAAHPDIALAAVPEREDIRDILFTAGGETLADLPPGARVGTCSPRREASLRRKRPDLRIEAIRGNVPSRLAKVRSGEYDATVLALAGLSRLGLTNERHEVLSLEDFLPAPRQGALAVECRASDTELRLLLGALDDPMARFCTTAEQGVLLGLNAGCATAVSAVATWSNGELRIAAELAVAQTGEVESIKDSFALELSDLVGASRAGWRIASRLLESPVSKRAALP